MVQTVVSIETDSIILIEGRDAADRHQKVFILN